MENLSSVRDMANNKANRKYRWDHYSDQPYPIKDKRYKRTIRVRAIPAYLKTLLVTFWFFPQVLLQCKTLPRFSSKSELGSKIGLCINLDKCPDETFEMVRDLGVRKLSIRIPLSDVERIDEYLQFAQQFSHCELYFVVVQDRLHIEDHALLNSSLHTVFSKLSNVGQYFQIGNAVNRTKWGFISVDEYLSFFKEAQSIRDAHFPDIKLFGSAIIDFELYAILRSLWHGFGICYDGIAALLYVDRRGGPEGRQFSFDLIGKLNFFWSAVLQSNKTGKHLRITEANWPIKDTAPYAPALGDVWVSETDYENYMLRYYLLALANGRAECIYWHQLIAPGYGLVDNREGFRKRRAYYIFYYLLERMHGSFLSEVFETENATRMTFHRQGEEEFQILWSAQSDISVDVPEGMVPRNACGKELLVSEGRVLVGQEPIYLLSE